MDIVDFLHSAYRKTHIVLECDVTQGHIAADFPNALNEIFMVIYDDFPAYEVVCGLVHFNGRCFRAIQFIGIRLLFFFGFLGCPVPIIFGSHNLIKQLFILWGQLGVLFQEWDKLISAT